MGPWCGLSHDVTDGFEHGVLICPRGHINDHLIMHMEDHRQPGGLQVVNGVGQTVTGNGLHAVFHQLAAVGFNAFPSLGFLVHAHVGDGGVAPLVFTNAGAHIVELAARGQRDGHAVCALVIVKLTGNDEAVDAHRAALGDDLHSSVVQGIP